MGGQHLGGLLSHLADTEAVDQAAKVVGLGFLNSPNQVLCRLGAHAVQLCNICCVETVKVSGIADKSTVH